MPRITLKVNGKGRKANADDAQTDSQQTQHETNSSRAPPRIKAAASASTLVQKTLPFVTLSGQSSAAQGASASLGSHTLKGAAKGRGAAAAKSKQTQRKKKTDEDNFKPSDDEEESEGSLDDSDNDPDFNHGGSGPESEEYKESESDPEASGGDYSQEESDEEYDAGKKRKRSGSSTQHKGKASSGITSPQNKRGRSTTTNLYGSVAVRNTKVTPSPYAQRLVQQSSQLSGSQGLQIPKSGWIAPHPNRLASATGGSLFLHLDNFRYQGDKGSALQNQAISKTLVPGFSSSSGSEDEYANPNPRGSTESLKKPPAPAMHNPVAQAQNVQRKHIADEEEDEDEVEEEIYVSKKVSSTSAPQSEFAELFTKLIDECVIYSERMQEILKRWKESTQRAESQRRESSMSSLDQPLTLTKKLHPHQIVGLSWLRLLRLQNMNGILADEMGLGKTITIIAYLEYLRTSGESGPHLIIVPSSTLDNWLREFSVWAPEMNVQPYRGSLAERSKFRKSFDQQATNVLMTTYSMCYRKEDRSFFKNVFWNQLILDEGHSIKNAESAVHQRISKIPSRYRLLVTGTPLQNNLTELWALLNFLMPKIFEKFKDIFHKEEELNQIFANQFGGDEEEQKFKSISQIRKCLEPFMLRRVRSDLTDLIEKVDILQHVDMTPHQTQSYQEMLKSSRNMWERHHQDPKSSSSLREDLDEEDDEALDSNSRRKMQESSVSGKSLLQNILMQLRKIANHPCLGYSKYNDEDIEQIAQTAHQEQLFGKSQKYEDVLNALYGRNDFQIHQLCEMTHSLTSFRLTSEELFDESGKLVFLKGMLKQYKQQGARILLFSQMTKMLDILEAFLYHLGYRYVRLDGSTPVTERQGLIDQYNTDKEIFIFLLSTKAGGFGINLSAANVVIFHDLDFNPEVDRQAEARCIRPADCTERKRVEVVKLISESSVDVHIYRRSQTKKEVNDAMLGGQKSRGGDAKDGVTSILRSLFEGANPTPKAASS